MSDTTEKRMRGSCHSKPAYQERSISDALIDASRLRRELPLTVQVYPSDWDKVILADALIEAYKKLGVQKLTDMKARK